MMLSGVVPWVVGVMENGKADEPMPLHGYCLSPVCEAGHAVAGVMDDLDDLPCVAAQPLNPVDFDGIGHPV